MINRKKGWVLLLLGALCVFMLTGCQQKAHPLAEEVEALFASARAEYDTAVKTLSETGILAIDGVQEIAEEIAAELDAIEAKIKASDLAKMSEKELTQIKDSLISAGDMISEMLPSEEELASFVNEIGDSLGEMLGDAGGEVEILLTEAETELDAIMADLEALGEKGSDALRGEYETLRAKVETLAAELSASEAAEWTQAQWEKVQAELKSVVESLQTLAETIGKEV